MSTQKRKLISNDDSETETSSDDDIPNLPCIAKRIEGQKYMKDGRIRIWRLGKLCCEHARDTSTCRLCSEPKFKCCGYDFMTNRSYTKHLNGELHLLTSEELKTTRTNRGKKIAEITYSIEKYIDSKLKLNPNIEFIIRTGNSGNKFDTVFKFREEKFTRGLQTKKLSKEKNAKGIYYISAGNTPYEDDTVLTGANLEHSVYFVVPWSKIKNTAKPHFSFTGKLKSYFYNDEEKFITALFKQLKNTTILLDGDLTNYLSKTEKAEYLSTERLRKICENHMLNFRKNETNFDCVDCFINNKPIQCKSSTSPRGEVYNFNIVKRVGREERPPYTDKDNIDFFIFNITIEEFHNDFYIIPKFVLVDRGYLSSPNFSNGRTSITIAPREYKKPHWTLEFLNKFSLITEEKLDPLLGKSNFEKECIEQKIEYKKGDNIGGRFVITTVENKKVRFLRHMGKEKKGSYKIEFRGITFGDKKKSIKTKSLKNSANIDVFIIEIDQLTGHFFIISKSTLIEKSYVKLQSQHAFIRIESAMNTSTHWSKAYWNNFSVFK